MSVCLSYLWLFWRRKSALLGCTFIFLLILICLHTYNNKSVHSYSPNYYNHDHHSGEDGASIVGAASGGIFVNAGSKKLQQSSNYIPEEEGVKFLPVIRKQSNKDHYAFQVSDETRRKVASKHRQVNPLPRNDPSGPSAPIVKSYLNERFEVGGNLQPLPFDGADYQRGPEAYLNPPKPKVYRGDHGPESDYDNPKPLYIPKQILVHLDLKGAPPKIDFLLKFIQNAKDHGATGLLIEYEDMFPFEGMLKDVAAVNHYNKSDIYNILIRSKELGLEVIPLVQTFGHMEFILKHGQFAHLRDSAEMPESICPCHQQTMSLIGLYIDQVMALHKDVKHLHIGCDEVYHLGECSDWSGQGRTDVFVKHVTNVANYVKNKYHQVESIIIWDDMLRNFMSTEMMPLKDLVVPMVWVYAEEVYHFMPTYNWDRFSEVFPTAWTASAYKGADGPTASVPNIQKRLTNNLNWLDGMSNEESKFQNGFQGIVITGWSRYDHFAVLAELLPAAMPSLSTNLISVSHGYFNASWQKELYSALQCADNSRLYDEFIDLESDPTLHEKMSWCFFTGSAIFKMIHVLGSVQQEVQEYLQKYSSQEGWLTEFNFRHNYSSPFRVNEGLDEHNRMTYLVTSLTKQAQQALSEIYDDYTVAEWIEQKIYPLHKDLNDFKARAESLKRRNTWPRRPFPILKAVQEMLATSTTTSKPLINPGDPNQIGNQKDSDSDSELVTVRPKRLVQAPDYYRHPPGSF